MTDDKLTPMEIMQRVSPLAARSYMTFRASVLENTEANALPEKVKLLIGIGVAASLQSSTCTLMWTKLAKKARVSDQEIAETIMVSRLMKAATVNDAAADALAWLFDCQNEGGAK